MSGKKQLWFILAGLGIMLALPTACSSSNEVKIGAEANGGEVKMYKGQMLILTLESNPTTGYAWEVAEVDPAVLQMQGEAEYQAGDTGGTQVVGGGGTETLRFTAVNPGETPLRLVYRRSWEKDVEPLNPFSIQVIVR